MDIDEIRNRLRVARVIEQLRWEGVWWDVFEVAGVVREVLRRLETEKTYVKGVVEVELRRLAESSQTAEMARAVEK